jgi:hypothetical protein
MENNKDTIILFQKIQKLCLEFDKEHPGHAIQCLLMAVVDCASITNDPQHTIKKCIESLEESNDPKKLQENRMLKRRIL